jgi:hypothetical protein
MSDLEADLNCNIDLDTEEFDDDECSGPIPVCDPGTSSDFDPNCDADFDPDSIWVSLCLGEREAVGKCKAFLYDYVVNSHRQVMVTTEEEWIVERGVNHASTVMSMWRTLVKEADLSVLETKRQQDHENRYRWRLRFQNCRSPDNKGLNLPESLDMVHEISQVSPWSIRYRLTH